MQKNLKTKQASKHDTHDYPFVSVIIPVYNDMERLAKCLDVLSQQTYPVDFYEIVVVDNGSEISPEPVISRFKNTRLFFEEKKSAYAARNKGVSVAKGSVLVFTDSDCIPCHSWLEKGVDTLIRCTEQIIVGGKIKFFFSAPDSPNIFELYDSCKNLQQEKYIKQSNFILTANLFTLRKTFDVVGGFNEKLMSGGDAEWGNRACSAGYKLLYEKRARIDHPARCTMRALVKKTIRVTIGGAELQNVYPEWFGDSGLLRILSFFFNPPVFNTYREFKDEGFLKRCRITVIELILSYTRGVCSLWLYIKNKFFKNTLRE